MQTYSYSISHVQYILHNGLPAVNALAPRGGCGVRDLVGGSRTAA